MTYPATVCKVMIASPSDVTVERSLVREILSEWNAIHSETHHLVLMPVGWDSHASPAMGDRPQEIINKTVLKGCDLLVGIFWTRLGTNTGRYSSGTVEEIEEHIKLDKPAMLYFSSAPVVPDSVDPAQYADLKNFKSSCQSRGLLQGFDSPTDFRNKFYRDLQMTIINKNFFDANRIPSKDIASEILVSATIAPAKMSREASVLLKEASKDTSGVIMRVKYIGGSHVQTNGKSFGEPKNPRDRATWEGALDELETSGLVQDRGYKREVYVLTRDGYAMAEMLPEAS